MSKILQVFDRLSLVLNVKSDTALSNALGVPRTTLASWKARDSIPYEECLNVSKSVGVSLDWILTGEGPMYRSNDPRLEAMSKLMDGLTEEQQREICAVAEEKKRLNQLAEQVEELKRVVGKSD